MINCKCCHAPGPLCYLPRLRIPIVLRISASSELPPVLRALLTTLIVPQENSNLGLQGRAHNAGQQAGPVETSLMEALSSLQERSNFQEIVSTTNDYNQTLAHLSVLYGYHSLLGRLVDWHINDTIADVNGLTALHCAYMKGDLDSVHMLRRGGASVSAKDNLGRIPSDLQPEELHPILAPMHPRGSARGPEHEPDLELELERQRQSQREPATPALLEKHLGTDRAFADLKIIAPVIRLPPELLQHILFLITDDDAGDSPLMLMLVCKQWYTIVTRHLTPLKLGTRTPRDTVTRKLGSMQWLLDVVIDTEIDRSDFAPSEGAYEGIFAAIDTTSRWRSLVVETFLEQADLPMHLVDRGLQWSKATMNRLKILKVKSACKMSPLLDHLLRVLGTTASSELTTMEISPAPVISFLLPAYSPIFRSVKVLTLDISGSHDPVDLLPHLHQLEELTASCLSLPIYADYINLPFVNTLRHLRLRAVSIQWMNGRTFYVLESCTISFPLRHHTPPIFGLGLPNCKDLIFQGHPLDILGGISAPKLLHLSVTCSASFSREGGRQLDLFTSQVLRESRLAPRVLHIGIEATSQAWVNALTFMPDLEELVIENTHPSSIGVKVLQSLSARLIHASSTGSTSIPEEWDAPLCPSLKRFGLKYRRWLRPTEHLDLVPGLVSIILSRRHSNCSLQRLWVWMRSDQRDPLELIEDRGMNHVGFERLAYESGVEKGDLRGFMAAWLVSAITRPSGESFNTP